MNIVLSIVVLAVFVGVIWAMFLRKPASTGNGSAGGTLPGGGSGDSGSGTKPRDQKPQ